MYCTNWLCYSDVVARKKKEKKSQTSQIKENFTLYTVWWPDCLDWWFSDAIFAWDGTTYRLRRLFCAASWFWGQLFLLQQVRRVQQPDWAYSTTKTISPMAVYHLINMCQPFFFTNGLTAIPIVSFTRYQYSPTRRPRRQLLLVWLRRHRRAKRPKRHFRIWSTCSKINTSYFIRIC